MSRFIDYTGQQFNRLHVDSFSHFDKNHKAYYNCTCVCGNKKCVSGCNLKSGAVKSCGCLQNEKLLEKCLKHNGTGTRLYRIWKAMKNRCFNPNDLRYIAYGGRGINICDEWINDFNAFREWSNDNGYNDCLSIDRIDNNLGYSPDNCRWVDDFVQQNNKHTNHLLTYNNKTQTIAQWSREVGIKASTIAARINYYQWPVERALTEPVRSYE